MEQQVEQDTKAPKRSLKELTTEQISQVSGAWMHFPTPNPTPPSDPLGHGPKQEQIVN